MRRLKVNMAENTNEVAGKVVSRVVQHEPRRIDVHFTDDSVLAVELVHGGVTAALRRSPKVRAANRSQVEGAPTSRQQEYLAFIAKYIARYRISPAESDIARHFLVSAPSVNQMIQVLERRGFIRRQPGIPRSITIADDRTDLVCPKEAAAVDDSRPNNALRRAGTSNARSGR